MDNKNINMRAVDGNIVRIECHRSLPSTVELARAYAKIGYPDRFVVLAENRNKQGKDGKYHGETEKGVFMSLILRPSFFPSQASHLGATGAAALATALEEHTTKNVGIGWMSNLYCDGRLIGGVSVEGKFDSYTSYEYILINFSAVLNNEDFPPRLTDLVKKVFEKESSSIGIIIAKNILNKFFSFYSHSSVHAKVMAAYRQKFILAGKKVKYTHPSGKKEKCTVLSVENNTFTLKICTRKNEEITVNQPFRVSVPKRVSLKNLKRQSSRNDQESVSSR